MRYIYICFFLFFISVQSFAAVADIAVNAGSAYSGKPIRLVLNLRTANLTNYQYFSVTDNPISKSPVFFNASPSSNYYTVNFDVIANDSGIGRVMVVSDRNFTYTASFVDVQSSDLDKQLSFLLGGMVALAFSITFAQRL